MAKVTGRLRFVLLLCLVSLTIGATSRGEARGAAGVKHMPDMMPMPRANGQLVGYGLVTGLNGTGDDFKKSPLTRLIVCNLLRQRRILPTPQYHHLLKSKNVALVMVCIHPPPFARFGTILDAGIMAMQGATDLSGGTLQPTALTGFDGTTQALARGLLTVDTHVNDNDPQISTQGYAHEHATGRVAQGAVIIKPTDSIVMSLNNKPRQRAPLPEITTSTFHAGTASRHFYQNTRNSWNIGRIWRQPLGNLYHGESCFLTHRLPHGKYGNKPVPMVINKKTGRILLGWDNRVSSVTLSRGNINMVITESMIITQPEPLLVKPVFDAPPAVALATENRADTLKPDCRVSTGDIAEALYAIGATPGDLIAVFMVLMAEGALRGELIVL